MTASGWPYLLGAELALSRVAHDRAGERRSDDDWLAAAWTDPATRVLRVAAGRTPVVDGRLATVGPADAPDGERLLLGIGDDGTTYTAVLMPDDADLPHAQGLRQVGALLDDREAGLLVHAVAVGNWHSTHRHCPRCGAPTVPAEAGHVRRCTRDGSEHYPRTDPAIIVAVVDPDDRCLLGRQATWPAGRFSTLAGFVEPGESLEAAVAREVHEESAVVVTEIAYAGSQPWPFPSSLMLGFYARAGNGDVQPDGQEIAEARWFSRTDLQAALTSGDVVMPPSVSIARRLVEGWYGGALPGGTAWRTRTND